MKISPVDHSFYVLSSATDRHYKAADFWYPQGERTLRG